MTVYFAVLLNIYIRNNIVNVHQSQISTHPLPVVDSTYSKQHSRDIKSNLRFRI
jgi:hypothetical protein